MLTFLMSCTIKQKTMMRPGTMSKQLLPYFLVTFLVRVVLLMVVITVKKIKSFCNFLRLFLSFHSNMCRVNMVK